MSASSDFYFARARESREAADETDLQNVRERCLRAEAAWLAIGNRLLKGEAARAAADAARQAQRDAGQTTDPHPDPRM